MGFINFIKNWSNQPKLTESGKAYVATRSIFSKGKVDDSTKDISIWEKYRNAYLRVPLVGSAIDTITVQAVQEYHFEGPSLNKLELFADKHNLLIFFQRIAKMLLIYGNAYVEVVRERGKIIELKILDPITIDVIRKNTGKVIGYIQNINDINKILWGNTLDKNETAKKVGKVDDIVHFKFNVIGSDKYGTSLIHRVLPIVNQKLNMEELMSVVIQRYVAPIIHIKVGSDETPATQTDVSNVENKIEDIYANTEFVTSHVVDASVLSFNGKSMDFDSLFKHVDEQIITGMMVPPVLLGRSDIGGQNAEVQLRSFTRMIKSLQRTLKVEFEDKIIIPFIGSEKDKLVWGSAEEREREIDFELVRGLVKDGIITPQKGNSLLPPKYHEKLPEPEIFLGRNSQDKGPDKLSDNPTDPTQVQKDGTRYKKTDRKVPMDDDGVKANEPKARRQKAGVSA